MGEAAGPAKRTRRALANCPEDRSVVATPAATVQKAPGDIGRLLSDDVGLIVVAQIRSLPVLRMLYCVCRGFKRHCRQRFIDLKEDIESKIKDEVQFMIRNDRTLDIDGMENTFVWQLLQVVLMRENVLRANRKIRLDVNSIFDAARTARIEFHQRISASNLKLEEMAKRLVENRKERSTDMDTAEILKCATQEFKDETTALYHKNARAIKEMNNRLKNILRKSSRYLKKNLRSIERVCEKCWNLALMLGSTAWIDELKAAMSRINLAVNERLRMGAKTRSKFELVRKEANCSVDVKFVTDDEE